MKICRHVCYFVAKWYILYFEDISNWIIDQRNLVNEITGKEVDFSNEKEKHETRKIKFQVKINGVDIERSKDIEPIWKNLSILLSLSKWFYD